METRLKTQISNLFPAACRTVKRRQTQQIVGLNLLQHVRCLSEIASDFELGHKSIFTLVQSGCAEISPALRGSLPNKPINVA